MRNEEGSWWKTRKLDTGRGRVRRGFNVYWKGSAGVGMIRMFYDIGGGDITLSLPWHEEPHEISITLIQTFDRTTSSTVAASCRQGPYPRDTQSALPVVTDRRSINCSMTTSKNTHVLHLMVHLTSTPRTVYRSVNGRTTSLAPLLTSLCLFPYSIGGRSLEQRAWDPLRCHLRAAPA